MRGKAFPLAANAKAFYATPLCGDTPQRLNNIQFTWNHGSMVPCHMLSMPVIAYSVRLPNCKGDARTRMHVRSWKFAAFGCRCGRSGTD
jgi:hypothetical protein